MKEIMLGLFGSHFDKMQRLHKWIAFDNFFEAFDVQFSGTIVGYVHKICVKADKINFLLDGLRIPLNLGKSCTCGELATIIDDSNLLDKTVFWLGNNPIDKEIVLKLIEYSNKEIFEDGKPLEELIKKPLNI